MSKFDHFHIIGPLYDHIFGRHVDRELVEIAEVGPDERVLDVGGGTGRVSILFRPSVQSVIVSDAALGMLRQAKARGLWAVASTAEKLPYAPDQFDLVIMVDAFHHVADQQATLDEMWRMLKPGGRIIIEEPDIDKFAVKLIAVGEKLLLMRSHFKRPEVIAGMALRGRRGGSIILRKGGNAWIIINKPHNDDERSV